MNCVLTCAWGSCASTSGTNSGISFSHVPLYPQERKCFLSADLAHRSSGLCSWCTFDWSLNWSFARPCSMTLNATVNITHHFPNARRKLSSFKSVYLKFVPLILSSWDFCAGCLSVLGPTVSQTGGGQSWPMRWASELWETEDHLESASPSSPLAVLCVLCHMPNLINSGLQSLSPCFNIFHNN